MAPTKIMFLILVTVTCCHCGPGYRREFKANAGDSESSATTLRSEEETIPENKGSDVEPATEEIQTQEKHTHENAQLKEDNTIGAHLRDKMPEQVDSNEDPQLNPKENITPSKSEDCVDKSIFPPQSKLPVLKVGPNDSYEKLLRAFKEVMAKVLQAEIRDVRVEETGNNHKRKKCD